MNQTIVRIRMYVSPRSELIFQCIFKQQTGYDYQHACCRFFENNSQDCFINYIAVNRWLAHEISVMYMHSNCNMRLRDTMNTVIPYTGQYPNPSIL